MHRYLTSWYSPNLHKEMPIAVYGHYGFALLLVPTAAADYLEYERFQLINALAPLIDAGKVKVFSVDSINKESWLNDHMDPRHKGIRHNQWNQYIFEEVVPFIKSNTSPLTPIIVSGASFGALHSANLFLKRPDLLDGFIAMSGVFDLTEYTKGYFDMEVYFNSPIHFIPNLTDANILNQIRSKKHLYIVTGSGNYENPTFSRRFSEVLTSKALPHELDIWGPDIHHDWPSWRMMLPYYLESRF